MHSVNSSCICYQHACGKLGIGVKAKAELNSVAVLAIKAGMAVSDNRATVGKSLVISMKLVKADEGYRGVVVGKVVWHLLDFFLNSCHVFSLCRYHVALTSVLLTGSEFGTLSASHSGHSRLNGNGVLPCINHAIYTSDGIRVTLAYATSPEGVILTIWQYCLGINS